MVNLTTVSVTEGTVFNDTTNSVIDTGVTGWGQGRV